MISLLLSGTALADIGDGITALVMVLLGLGVFALYIFALIQCARSTFRSNSTKILWILVIVVVPLGPFLWLMGGKGQAIR